MDLAIRTYLFLSVTVADLKGRLTDEDRGQTALEYILVLVLVGAIVAALMSQSIRSNLETYISDAADNLFTAEGGGN